ncbi:hypothetical protein Glove_279g20 [Diversispora epigaea]|uniref:Uncharacterized protein n=1 Tax=Diversispora epigaea TaxID=1348612 RepID=A0A397I8P9_9GLOM|nr:hypothetical protein Glove_279g20 [Diversispora epigaea]
MTPREEYVCRRKVTNISNISNISDISDIGIIIFANDDIILTKYMINDLQMKGAQNLRICYPENSIQHANLDVGIKPVPINWNNFEWSIENAIVVVSMLYNDFDKQETLLNACISQKVALFISWDSGMELEHYVTDKRCPRTRLHKRLIDYQAMKNNNHESMDWILFQVGIFDEEILKNDISTITTAFNSPSQYIFLNVTVKEDLAMLVAETITSKRVLPNRNYVIGDFVAHTFLQHAYQVANNGLQLDFNMPADISEFETTNQLRLSGIVSARPLPRILYPGCSIFFHKLGIEISFQHDAIIYKLLSHHKRISLKSWVQKNHSRQPSLDLII